MRWMTENECGGMCACAHACERVRYAVLCVRASVRACMRKSVREKQTGEKESEGARERGSDSNRAGDEEREAGYEWRGGGGIAQRDDVKYSTTCAVK